MKSEVKMVWEAILFK